MRNKMIILGITLMLLAVGLSGCNEENTGGGQTSKFVGTWTSLGSKIYIDVMELFSDGLARITNKALEQDYVHPATWEVEGDKLIIKQTDSDLDYIYQYKFTNDETLVLTQEYEGQTFGPYTYKKS